MFSHTHNNGEIQLYTIFTNDCVYVQCSYMHISVQFETIEFTTFAYTIHDEEGENKKQQQQQQRQMNAKRITQREHHRVLCTESPSTKCLTCLCTQKRENTFASQTKMIVVRDPALRRNIRFACVHVSVHDLYVFSLSFDFICSGSSFGFVI